MSSVVHKITVNLSDRSYPIIIGNNLLTNIINLLNIPTNNFLVVSDDVVFPVYGQILCSMLPQYQTFIVPSGESSKSWAHLQTLVEGFLQAKIDRHTAVIAIGGGVVGDLAGFAASITLRGIPVVHIPTTLLSQVDSAIGGKTAINSQFGKNLIGAFYQPSSVIIDTDLLKTLPKNQLVAGYGEILKYAVLGDANFFQFLQQNHDDILHLQPQALAKAIAISCQMKADIVADDEREQGRRALLNLGHTFGHAIEHVSDFNILHGHAVLLGLSLAADLSNRLGFLSQSETVMIQKHVKLLQFNIDLSGFLVSDLIHAMGFDKKKANNIISFILLSAIGQAFVHKTAVPDNILRDVWLHAGARL